MSNRAYLMLAAKSLPPSLPPDVRIKMHATMLITSVAHKTSHSWKSRVMSERESWGISSSIEWNINGKTISHGQ
jgi:hypothetical protein